MERVFRDCYGATSPPCLIIEGNTKAGKSFTVDRFIDRHPRVITEEGINIPVATATLYSPATHNNFLTSMLFGIQDPRADKGSIGNKMHRLKKYVGICNIRMFIVDEVQHFLSCRDGVLNTVTDMFKVIIKENKIGCIFVGIKGEVEQVVNANPQLASMFPDVLYLDEYQWDLRNNATTIKYRKVIHSIEQTLPLNKESNLSGIIMAEKIYTAAGGSLGFTVMQVKSAAKLALEEGEEKISMRHLSQAFDLYMAGKRRRILNPFE